MPQTPPSSRPGGIRFTDRVFVAGTAGSGKSVLINHLAAGFRCQVMLYDTKDEFTVPGVEPVYDPDRIRWDERIIHLIDDSAELADVDRVFKRCWDRKTGRTGNVSYGLVVVVHEAGDLCLDQPGRTPSSVSNYVRKGRAHGLGLIAGAQRPRNIPRIVRTEAGHVFSFERGFDPEDIPVMAGLHRLTVPEYEAWLERASATGPHSYIWGDRIARVNVIRPPLPPSLQARTIASGLDPLAYRNTPEPDSGNSGTTHTPEHPGPLPSPSR